MLLHDRGTHSLRNMFTVDGEKGIWGFPSLFTAAAVRVSSVPFAHVPAEFSHCPVGTGFHLVLEDEKGKLHGLVTCRNVQRRQWVNGIVMNDSRGRAWLCAADDQENYSAIDEEGTFSGKGALRRISNVTAPAVEMLNLPDGRKLEDMEIWGGWLELEGDFVRGSDRTIESIDPATPHLADGLKVLEDRLDTIIARENRIERIAGEILTTDALKSVIARDFPLKDGIFPNWQDNPDRKSFDDRLFRLEKELAKEFRDAGLCAPCPNDGTHKVRGIGAWNAFLEGRLDGPVKSLQGADFCLHLELNGSPLFRMITYTLSHFAHEAEKAAWTEQNPDTEYKDGKQEPFITEAILDRMVPHIREGIVRALKFENDFHLMHAEFRSSLKENVRFEIMGSFLKPVLGIKDPETRIVTPAPVEEEPRIARHLELSLPSGRLIMADWFRIEGFNDTVKELCDGDLYEVSYPTARDDQSRAYYERLGLIHLPDRRAAIYEDQAGIWRAGRIDEDHGDFWRERPDGRFEANGLCPQPAWGAQVYDPSNTFADVEVIADILMASGKYQDRGDAMAAIDDYVGQGEARLAEIGAGKLHLYLPTGYGDHGRFTKDFRVDGLDYPEWRKDSFLLSRNPIAVDPGFMEENHWVEGRIDPEISKRSERNEEPGIEP